MWILSTSLLLKLFPQSLQENALTEEWVTMCLWMFWTLELVLEQCGHIQMPASNGMGCNFKRKLISKLETSNEDSFIGNDINYNISSCASWDYLSL